MSEDFAEPFTPSDAGAGASSLLARLYREIGLAAIAAELGVNLDDLAEPIATSARDQRRELAA